MKSSKSGGSGRSNKKLLNLDSCTDSVWLIKVPQFVAEEWASVKSGEVIGNLGHRGKNTLVINLTTTADIPTEFTLEDRSALAAVRQRLEGDPKNEMLQRELATLSEQNAVGDLHVFSEDIEKGTFSIDAKITKQLNLEPNREAEKYRKWSRKRSNAGLSRREAVVGNLTEIEDGLRKQSNEAGFIPPEPKKKKADRRHGLQGEVDTDGLKSAMFEAFGQNPLWKLSDLSLHCRQTVEFSSDNQLKELLAIYCTFTKSGADKGCYKLKDDYQDHTQSSPS